MTTNNHSKDLAALNREKTTQKVLRTLERLKKRKKPITQALLNKEAGIARQTLYNRPDLKAKLDEVNSLIKDRGKSVQEKTTKLSTQESRIKRLRNELQEVKDDFNKLLDQNASLTQKNFDLQEKVADLEEKLYKNSVIKLARKD